MTNLHALSGAYVLDALTPDESAEFEAHLTSCAECRHEVGGLRETVGLLGVTAVQTPPLGLRERVLAQVATTAQVAADPGSTELAADQASAPLPVQPPLQPPVQPSVAPRAVPRARRWRTWPVAAAAAAALVVGGVAGGTLAVRAYRSDQVASAALARMTQIAAAPDAASHEVALGVSHVVMSVEMSTAALVGQDVPMPAESGMTYQLWMVHADGSSAPGPTFMPESGEVLAFVEGDLATVAALTITEEPMAGSSEPTGPVVAVVTL